VAHCHCCIPTNSDYLLIKIEDKNMINNDEVIKCDKKMKYKTRGKVQAPNTQHLLSTSAPAQHLFGTSAPAQHL
jgi:hypothetical protein